MQQFVRRSDHFSCDAEQLRSELSKLALRRHEASLAARCVSTWHAGPEQLRCERQGWREFTGRPTPDVGQTWLEAIHPEDHQHLLAVRAHALETGEPYCNRYRVLHETLGWRWVSDDVVPLRDPDGKIESWVGVISDVHDREIAERALRASEERLRLCIESTGLGTWDVDVVTGAREWSREFYALLRIPPTTSPNRQLFVDRIHPDDRQRVQGELHESGRADGLARVSTFRLKFDDGDERWMEVRERTFSNGSGRPVRRVGTMQDVTDRKENEREVWHAAHTDALTGTANRLLFQARLEQAVTDAVEGSLEVVLLLVDLDYFKEVNDTLGHDAGDAVLRAVGSRLIETVPAAATVARLGGDEFGVILSTARDTARPCALASDLIDTLCRPVLYDGCEIECSATIGWAVRTGEDGVADILKHADIALYEAKAGGRGRSVAFVPAMREIVDRRTEALRLRRARSAGGSAHASIELPTSSDGRSATAEPGIHTQWCRLEPAKSEAGRAAEEQAGLAPLADRNFRASVSPGSRPRRSRPARKVGRSEQVLDGLDAFARRVCRLKGMDEFGPALVDAARLLFDGSRIEIFGSDGARRRAGDRLGSATPVPDGDLAALASRIAETGSERIGEAGLAWRSGGRHVLAMPIRAGNRLFGIVAIATVEPLDEIGRRSARLLCTIAAAALDLAEAGKTDRLLRKIVERSDEAVSLYDPAGTILFTNEAYHRIFPHYPEPSRLAGMTHEELYRHDLAVGVIDDPLARIDPERYLAERMRLFRVLKSDLREVQSIGDRTYFYTRARLDSGETFSRRIDITDVRAAEERVQASQRKIEEVTYVDAVTGLANRLRFRDVVDSLVEGGTSQFLVTLIDLDRFRAINDSLGDAAGNAVLAEVGTRLRARVAKTNVVARLGGDEFAVLQRLESGSRLPEELVGSLLAVFDEDIVANGRRLSIRASAGMALFPQDGTSADLLLQNAGLALDEARIAGHGIWRLFKAGMAGDLAAKRTLALDLAEAIALNQLDVHYQPLVDARSGAVVGFEALARWQHPDRGSVPPAQFIPIAEESGLIDEIGLFVLRRALADASRWPDGLRVAVNMSPKQIVDPDVVRIVAEAASDVGCDLGRLELEITETVLLSQNEQIVEALSRLRALGIGIALDDFGTGFSSLSYLLSFPFTKIKIDRRFISGIVDRRDAYAITTAVIDLASNLGMTTTAEGVETSEQADRLREMGCRELQGYFIAKPAPIHQLEHWLTAKPSDGMRSPRPDPAGS